MVNPSANPNAGRRPNLSGRRSRPKAVCPKCGVYRLLHTKTRCKPCYTKEHPVKEGNCAACGRWMRLPYRQLCDRCSHVLPADSGVDCRRRAVGAEDAAMAAAYQQAFVDKIMERVRCLARRRLWELPLQDKLEKVAEAVALAWEVYLQERKRGYDPLRSPMMLAKRVVGKILFGQQLAGSVSMEDVLSRRRRKARNVMVVSAEHQQLRARPTPDVAEEIDRKEWLARLPYEDRRVIEFLNDGNSWEDAKAQYGMKAAHVRELLDRLWQTCVRRRPRSKQEVKGARDNITENREEACRPAVFAGRE